MNSTEPDIDYYGVLKLKKDCNDSEIKKAFRHLAIYYNVSRQKNEDIVGCFNLIAEAYEVLSDPLNRVIYDQYGETGLKRGVPWPNGHISPYVFHGDPYLTFREFFGTSNPYGDLLNILEESEIMKLVDDKNACKHNDELSIRPLPLTLVEIFFGAVKRIEIERTEFIDAEETDNIFDDQIFEFIVKPGLPTATKIVVGEKVGRERNKVPADIVFITEDIPHEIFKRRGDNLVMTVDIFLSDALIGTTVLVHTLDDRIIRVPITSVITPDYEKCIVGEGLPMAEKPNERGNLIINFKINFPMYLPLARKYDIVKGFGKAPNK